MGVAAPTAYCTTADLSTFGAPAAALVGIDPTVLQACVDGANGEADSYLGNVFTLPLLQWGPEVKKFCAALAIYDVFVNRGFDPGSPELAEQVRDRATDARAWFRRVGEGKATPANVIDSSSNGAAPAQGGPGGLFVTQATVQIEGNQVPGAINTPSADPGGSFIVQVGRPTLRGW